MAARDRFGAYADPSLTPLQRAIHNACDPANYEPNLALNLEVVDLINSKKGNSPREAAMAIVHLVNARNQNVSLLALALLDICVKNCGYPFHLQISTKEFLNELVRRFPERPPLRASRVQHRILESIEEWRQTICQTSRYKDDLGFIRDMHRLLVYKGYSFPEVRLEDAAVLNESDNLRSAEEMEEEDRAAQSAKLQELIRRGTPQDLQEANKLMKVMAGYDTRNKTDYRAKAAEEVGHVQQKAKILEEMLQSLKPGDKVDGGDVFEELANALQSAYPKIQKMCEEESDDAEAVAKLLQINDSIGRTIERYKLVKKGDVEGAAKIPKGTLGTTTGVSRNANNEFSLIDFDPEPESSSNGDHTQAADHGTASLENDLLGLSFSDRPQVGPVSLSYETPPSAVSGGFQQKSASRAKDQIMSAFRSSQISTPAQSSTPPFSQPPQPSASTALVTDPFASLVSPSPRAGSPFISTPSARVHQSQSPSPSLVDLGGSTFVASQSHAQPVARANRSTDGDEEWTFESALPEAITLPSTSKIRVLTSASLVIDFVSRRNPGHPRQIHVVAVFSNGSNETITDLHFQVAVERTYTLQLRPQSGRDIPPLQQNGVKQEMLLDNVDSGKGNAIKMRFKVSYHVGGQTKEDQGVIPPLGIA